MNKLILILIFLIIYEIIICFKRKVQRRIYFKRAIQRSKETHKKLLVIGDPYNGVASISTGADYDCGDICVDITGCPKCEKGVKMKLEDFVKNNLDDYIIYISCVLEYTTDLPLIQSYLNKVPPENLFIVNVEWYSLMSYIYPYYLTGEQPPSYVKGPSGKYFKNDLKI